DAAVSSVNDYNSHLAQAIPCRVPARADTSTRGKRTMTPVNRTTRAARFAGMLAAACAALLLAACGQQPAAPEGSAAGAGADAPAAGTGAGEVNLYTTREPGLIQPLLDAFTDSTGIQVNTVFLKDGLMERLGAEGGRSPADVLMTVDTGNLLDVVDAGYTQAVDSDVLEEAIPAHLRGEEGHWFTLSLRDRVLYA